MGGVVSTPQAPAAPAVPTPVAGPVAVDEAGQRMEALERRRRGRSGTIRTSERGLVEKSANAPQKKSLLGE